MTSYRTGLAAAVTFFAFVVTGCGDDRPPPADTGTLDTSVGDTSVGDTSVTDTGTTDTGTGDTSVADTGTGDTSVGDTSVGDTSVGDTGVMDSAIPDGGLPVGATCSMSSDCASGICIVRICRAPACADGILNGDETDTDCGGPLCAGCDPGDMCGGASDCASGICTGGTCDAPSCTDGIINQDESDVDCGGTICPDRCAVMEMCGAGTDCATGSCSGGECQAPTCTDGVRNGRETDTDCGGPRADGCPRCPDFSRCDRGRDCVDGNCTMGFCGTNPCVPFGTDTYGYTGCSFTPGTLPCPDISGTGTATSLGDDDSVSVAIGFSFDFYGTAYTNVNVESNGGLSFDTGGFSTGVTCPLPSTSAFDPQILIAAFWDDLDPGEAGSNVWYQTLGSAGSRQFVAQWDTERFLGSTDRGVFTVVLNEGSDDIQVCYVDTDFADVAYDAGASAAAGIQGSTTDANQFSCNTPDLTDGLLIQYLHP